MSAAPLGPHRRHNRRVPCPVCGHPDWCVSFEDGWTLCERNDEHNGKGGKPARKGSGWLHWTGDGPAPGDDWRDRLAAVSVRPPAPPVESPFDPDLRDRGLSAILEACPLSADDWTTLAGRGLIAEQIERHRYGTLPPSSEGRRAIAATVVAACGPGAFGQIPGLYRGPDGAPMIAGASGILIPSLDPARRVQGVRIRAADPSSGAGGKYRWLSSPTHTGGAGSGAPIHLAMPAAPLTTITRVGITEGEIKANVIADRLGFPVLGVPGATITGDVLPLLHQLGVSAVVLMFDADRAVKPQVAQAETRLIGDLTAAGLDVKRATWPDLYKGLDDALVAGVIPLIEPVTPPCAEIVAERDQEIADLRAENAKLKRTVSVVIATVTNPSLKAEAATLVRTAVEIDRQRREGSGQVGPDGFRRLDTARIGDDWTHVATADGPPPVAPIRGRSTVNRHVQNLAEFGLLDHRIEEVPKELVLPDKRTGLPRKRTMPVKETYVRMPGEGLAEMLQAAALFRREQPSNHGGRRPRKETPADEPLTCPSCGSTNLACRDCGVIIEEALPPSSFQDESALDVKRATPSPPAPACRSSQIQDETTKPRPLRAPDDAAWIDTVTVDEEPGASLGETRPASPILSPRLPLTGARIPLAAADHAAERDQRHRIHDDLAAHLEPLARAHGRVPVPKPGPELRPVAIDDGDEDGYEDRPL